MEEASDLGGEAAIHVVDEGIEEAGGAMEREDVVVCDAGGDEGAMACLEEDVVTGAAHVKGAVAFEAHGDDEAVVLEEVTVEGLGNLHDTDTEIRGVDNLDGTVGGVCVFRTVVALHMVVEGLSGELSMELTRLAIHARAVVVEDAIGDIT